MKLTFSAASPFARKVRIAAIELGLIDKIQFVPVTVKIGEPNEEYSKITPLKKLPVLILDDGEVILDSYVIVEYLNELAGGGLIPEYGPTRWRVKSDHSLLQGMLDSMLLCRYENSCGRKACTGKPGMTTIGIGSGPAWRGSRRATTCSRARSRSRRSPLSACWATRISALPTADGTRLIQNSIASTRRCWSGHR